MNAIVKDSLVKHEILIGMLLRNNAKSILYQLNIFKNIENLANIKISYIFLENGSIDNSNDLIREFMISRDGVIVTAGNTQNLDKLDRISRISQLRNQVKRMAVDFNFKYMLILDSDIFFNADIIEKLINKMEFNSNIGVACAYGIAYLPEEAGIKTNNHYYDTSALIIGENEPSYYPRCVFKGCLECGVNKFNPMDFSSLEVFSAFGGLALYREDVIKNSKLFWIPSIMNNSPVSEHIGFFIKLHENTEYSVTVNTDCPVFWDVSTLRL
jgi:hypothetical protein